MKRQKQGDASKTYAGRHSVIPASRESYTTPGSAFSAWAGGIACGVCAADEVTDWNRILSEALIEPPAVAVFNMFRPAAIVQAAVFDAVNGIERRFTPVHVTAPPGASQRAWHSASCPYKEERTSL
jgi:hypothetical protein